MDFFGTLTHDRARTFTMYGCDRGNPRTCRRLRIRDLEVLICQTCRRAFHFDANGMFRDTEVHRKSAIDWACQVFPIECETCSPRLFWMGTLWSRTITLGGRRVSDMRNKQ